MNEEDNNKNINRNINKNIFNISFYPNGKISKKPIKNKVYQKVIKYAKKLLILKVILITKTKKILN